MSASEISGSPPTPAPWFRDVLLLALAFGALYFFVLGRAPLANPDEGRYAEIPRGMLATGDWVTPRLDGVNYFEKPPLMYWAVAASLNVFGLNEWAVRAVPALFALGGVLLAYGAGRALRGRGAGIGAAVVLGTSLMYFAHARIPILDTAVAVLMSAALFCFILAVRRPPGAARRWLFYGLYASAALATLTKGLIGFALTGLVMFVWLLVFNQWKRLRPLHLPTGAVLFLAIAAPWHVLVAERNPAWARFYLVHEHWQRFTTTDHHRYHPFWYFIPFVFLGLFPWIGFLWPALREELAGGWARRKENAEAWFLAAWAAVIFLFFSKSQSKIEAYILPVFPPLAVLIGAWLARRWEAAVLAPVRGGLMLFSILCGLLAAGLVAIVLHPALVHNLDPGQAAALKPYVLAAAAVLAGGGVIRPWIGPARGTKKAVLVMAGTTILFYGILALAVPAIAPPDTKPLALQVRALARPGDRVYHYHHFFHDFTFYARRTVGVVGYQDELEPANDDPARIRGRFIDDAQFRREWSGPGRVFAAARKREVGALFADPSFHYHLLGETPDAYLFSNQN